MCPDMHACGIEITEPGLALLGFATNEIFSGGKEFLIHCFHALFVERTCVFNLLLSNFSELRINSGVVLISCLTFQNATGPEFFAEGWIFWIVRTFGFFFCI